MKIRVENSKSTDKGVLAPSGYSELGKGGRKTTKASKELLVAPRGLWGETLTKRVKKCRFLGKTYPFSS